MELDRNQPWEDPNSSQGFLFAYKINKQLKLIMRIVII